MTPPLEVARPAPAGRAPRRRRFAIAAFALAAAACGRDMTVYVRAGDRPPNPDANVEQTSLTSATRVDAQPLLAAGVTIDRFQVVLRKVRLQAQQVADGSPAPNDLQITPDVVLVDLSGERLDPGAMTQIVPARLVPWSSYYQASIQLAPVTQADVASDATLAPLLGNTFVITGRLPGGAPFTFTSSLATVLVSAYTWRNGLNHNNTTINFAPNQWFVGPDGSALDPRDPANRAAIEANFLQSVSAYMDDNQDGKPDSLG